MDVYKMLDKIYQRILDIVANGKPTDELTDLTASYQLFNDLAEKDRVEKRRADLYNDDNLQSSYNRARIKAFKREGNTIGLMRMLNKN